MFRLDLDVQVLVAVIRLPQHGSDLVLSLNTPVFISQQRCIMTLHVKTMQS